jgi:hypothetical protein
MGRPSDYTPETAGLICEQIAEGLSIRTICKEEDMPCMSTIFKWLNIYPEFTEQYARAKEAQADAFAEELLDISDDGSNDWLKVHHGDDDKEVGWRVNGEAIQRSRLRVDSRKWLMGKMKPKKYGEKLAHTGADGEGPIEFKLTRAGKPNGE